MGKNSKKQFRRNERTYRGHQNLDKFLSDKKLQRKQVAKDGSCLFRAVAEQVFSSQSYHQKVRMQCVEYIQAHQDDFKEFIIISIPEYLDQLKNELWGGELELVVLSRLYERSIIIYNEANGIVHEQVFQASEDQAGSQQHNPIMLAFSNGNHYDSVYSTQHIKNTAFCQGIVYETLFLRVFKDTMPPPCKQRLASLQDSDMEQIRMHQEASHYDRPFIERPVHLLSTHYMIEEIESMAANIYRNTAMDVHQREKASIERRDRHVAASIQFQRGDAITFKVGDKEMEGEIANLYASSAGCHLVYMPKSGETWEIPAKDITLKQSHPNSGRRSTSGQYRSRSQQQQQQFSGQTSGQKGQQQSAQSDSSKAVDTPTALTKETPSSKKSGAQGGKSKEGKKGSSTSQQGSQNLSSKGVPASAIPLQVEKTTATVGGAPPPRTPSSDQKQKSSSSVSPPGGTGVESSTAGTAATGQRRVAPSLSRNIQHTQVQSGHSIKAIPHSAKVTKRTDAGSLDSDDPSSTSDDESSPHSEHHHSPHSRRRPHHSHPHQATRANTTNDGLPAYYDEDDWSTGEQENVAATTTLQKQQAHIGGGKERKSIPVTEGKLHVGRGRLGYSDTTSIKQQQQQQGRATQKAVSGQSMKSGGGGGGGTITKACGEVKVATSSQSSSDSSSKLGSRQTGTTTAPPVTKREPTRTSPARKKQSQQQSPQQPSNAVMQVPAPAGLLQQQSPIQGLIDGPNSERDGRESPPYLERLIPRDPSSQPQDAWPLFEEDPAIHPTTNLPPSVEAMMLGITSRQQQHRAPPQPSSPPASSGIVLPPHSSSAITTTHNGNPPPLPAEQGTGIIPMVPPLAHAHAQQQPTPPQSPVPDQLQTGGGAGQPPPPLPGMFPPTVPPISPPSSTTSAMPAIFHPLMQPRHFIPPMTTAAAVQQFFAVSGQQDMLYNQAHHTHSNVTPPLPNPSELASSGGGGSGGGGSGNGSGESSSMTSLVSPLQPMPIKKSSPRSGSGERTTTAMSPLTVTAYTQTFFPKLTSAHTQTEVKKCREEGTQFNPHVKEAWAQTDRHYVAATELSPPELENDSKDAKVNFAIDYSIKCLNVYLQYVDDDETPSELLQMLENLKEQQLEEQAMPYKNQLTALNASQQDFIMSLARDRAQRFPINAHPVGEGATGMSFYQPKPMMMKESTPPQAGEDVTLQQAAASLPVLPSSHGIPPDASLTSSSSTSDLLPSAQDDDKSSETNVDMTPQQEIQPPAAAPPYPIPPHLMMHPQRYMMPLPMFYNPSFYPPSFPGMPGLPGMPGMMMPPYGHHVIPPMHQQQQPAPQPEQNLESLEEEASTTSTPTTKLSPPTSDVIPNQPPITASIELESPSSTSVDHQSVHVPPMVDSVQGLHVTAFQAEDIIPEDPTLENAGEGGIVLQPTDPISAMLEEHQQGQQEDDGEQQLHVGPVAFIPSATTSEAYIAADAVQHPIDQVGDDYQMQDEENVPPPTVESDVNMSNPGLPCRGSSGGSTKETDPSSGEDKENEQKVDTKQQKPKSLRTKQQMPQENNTSSKQQSKVTYQRQQQNYQRTGTSGVYSNKSSTYHRGRYTYNNYGNQRQQQYRRYNYQSNGGRMYNRTTYNSGGNGGRYQQKWNQGGQQYYGSGGGGSSSYSSSSSSEQAAGRPHNPSRSKLHTSSSGSSDHNSSGKSVTPVPATTNASASAEDHDRNVPQFNNSNNNYSSSGTGKFSPKSFTSFPSSPQNHHSSINGDMSSTNMVVPQTATDSAPATALKEGEKKANRWHFKDTASDRDRLEVPDPNLWNWTSGGGGDRQFGYGHPGDYAETVEDPFPTGMTVGVDDKEFAFKDECMDDFDARQMEELFPALKSAIPSRYDATTTTTTTSGDGILHPPAQCSNRSDIQAYRLAGSGGGYYD